MIVRDVPSKKGTNKRAKRRQGQIPTPFLDYARLIADPCNGPVSSGVDVVEGTIVERARRVIPIGAGGTATSGMVVWFPSYSSAAVDGAVSANYNLFAFESNTPSVAPVNTAAIPMGSGAATAGLFIADPSSKFVTSTSSFSRTKALSACIQFEWLGALSAIQGQVCVIKNLSLSAFDTLTGASGHTYQPMSVDDIFSYAAERTRTQIGGHEAVWRPTPNQSVYRTNGLEVSTVGQSDLADVCFFSGTALSGPTLERTVNPNDTNGIIIAWKGFPAGGLSQAVCTKTFYLELASRAGAIEAIPRQLSDESSQSRLAAAIKYLDTMMPNWQSKTLNAGVNVVGTLAKAYAPMIMRSASRPYLNQGPVRRQFALRDGEL